MVKEHIDKIKALPLFSGQVSIEPVPAGIVNHAYKVIQGQEAFLVKFLPHKDVGQTPRKTLFDLQLQLAEKQLAVKPLMYDDGLKVWVEQWCDLPVYSADNLEDDDTIRHLASTMCVFHNTKTKCPTVDIVGAWQRYLQKIPTEQLGDLQAQVDALTPKMQRFTEQDLVMCHHDLSLPHLTKAPHRVAFDWEYAGLGNRYFDLSSTILINRMPAAIATKFIDSYAVASGDAPDLIRKNLVLIEPCVSLTYLLWMMAEPHRD